jgi:hypothetical protein
MIKVDSAESLQPRTVEARIIPANRQRTNTSENEIL